jgi:diguanylate cyclase (GGDEF)-like protein
LFIVPLVPCAWLIYQHAWHAERSLRSIVFTFSLCIVALLVRGVHAGCHRRNTPTCCRRAGQGGTFLMAFVALLGAGWGFVLAGFERTASQLEVLATHDGPQAVVNRRTADAMLSHASHVAGGWLVALVLIDIDHFKQINDRYGHATGDEALRAFAAAVRLRLRNSDVFGRWGGEEFGLILPATDRPGAMRLAEEVRASVEALELQAPDSGTIAVRMSAGVAIAPSDSELKSATLYRLADQALYAAKHQGRNRWSWPKHEPGPAPAAEPG